MNEHRTNEFYKPRLQRKLLNPTLLEEFKARTQENDEIENRHKMHISEILAHHEIYSNCAKITQIIFGHPSIHEKL